jgi:hypothetical protein
MLFGRSEKDKQPIKEGYYNARISDINDVTEKLSQYGDLCLELTYQVEGVPFEINQTIFIKFEFGQNGELSQKENSWIRQFNNLLDTIGYKGGFNNGGVFVNQDGDAIDNCDIAFELTKHTAEKFDPNEYCFVVYLERTDKGYTRPAKRVYPIAEKKQLEKYIDFIAKMKKDKKQQLQPGPTKFRV